MIKLLIAVHTAILLAFGVSFIVIDAKLTRGEAQLVNRPLGNCLEQIDLLRNRPYPPAHGVHSYAKPVPICQVKS